MSGRLPDKVCIITGTGGSIGRATALTFAREGARVVGCGQTVEPAAATVEMVHAADGAMVSMQPCELTDPPDCQALVELALRRPVFQIRGHVAGHRGEGGQQCAELVCGLAQPRCVAVSEGLTHFGHADRRVGPKVSAHPEQPIRIVRGQLRQPLDQFLIPSRGIQRAKISRIEHGRSTSGGTP